MPAAVAQQSRTEQITHEESLTLVRNLMRTAISSISYLRNLFPEDCFQDRTISGIQIKSLIPSNPEAKTLIDWLEKGVFEALKKKYLRVIIFGICLDQEREMETMIESYEFKISYPDQEGAVLNVSRSNGNTTNKKVGIKCGQTKKEITQSMCMMLRTLITLAQTLNQIPESRFITMKLLYYDDITPVDYEPEFFRAMKVEETKVFHKDFVKLKIGEVNTKYHSMNIRVRTLSESIEDDVVSTSSNNSCFEKANTQLNVSQFAIKNNENNSKSIPAASAMQNNEVKSSNAIDDNVSDITQVSEMDDIPSSPNNNIVNQISTVNNNNSSIEMAKKQLLEEKEGILFKQEKEINRELSTKFSELNCNDLSKIIKEVKVDQVKKLDENERNYLKVLIYVLQQETITGQSLVQEFDITNYFATKYINRMEKEGYLKANSNKRKGKIVVKNDKRLRALKEIRKSLEEEEEEVVEEKKKDVVTVTKTPPVTNNSSKKESSSNNKKGLSSQIPNNSINQQQEGIVNNNNQQSTSPKQQIQSSNTLIDEVIHNEEEEKINDEKENKGLKRKLIDQFEVSYSQDGITNKPQSSFNMEEFTQHPIPTSFKMSTVSEPIDQKKRKLYRNPKEFKG
ncbi:hypothetical protein ABK040_006096 [Willaertia magna]